MPGARAAIALGLTVALALFFLSWESGQSGNESISTEVDKMSAYEKLTEAAETYFKVWNTHDVKELAKCFIEKDAMLTDWDIQKDEKYKNGYVMGTDNVVAANGGIFKNVPTIKIEPKRILVDTKESSAVCEILVHIGDQEKTVLQVVDVIDFDSDYKIKRVRAYLLSTKSTDPK
ncbi:hypothetical protein AAMO2058_001711000 [Amorphochlora amoebiformis]